MGQCVPLGRAVSTPPSWARRRPVASRAEAGSLERARASPMPGRDGADIDEARARATAIWERRPRPPGGVTPAGTPRSTYDFFSNVWAGVPARVLSQLSQQHRPVRFAVGQARIPGGRPSGQASKASLTLSPACFRFALVCWALPSAFMSSSPMVDPALSIFGAILRGCPSRGLARACVVGGA